MVRKRMVCPWIHMHNHTFDTRLSDFPYFRAQFTTFPLMFRAKGNDYQVLMTSRADDEASAERWF